MIRRLITRIREAVGADKEAKAIKRAIARARAAHAPVRHHQTALRDLRQRPLAGR